MKDRIIILTMLCVHCGSLGAAETTAVKPNIIVVYTDDHGYADLSIQGSLADIKTPNIDALARSGVLAKHGYSTAPQCVPSRAGLLVGKFQGRFNLDSNGGSVKGFDQETTIATRLQKAGYVTAQFGKWHLGPTAAIPAHGFKHVFAQNSSLPASHSDRWRPLGMTTSIITWKEKHPPDRLATERLNLNSTMSTLKVGWLATARSA